MQFAKDNDRKDSAILRDHYLPKNKPKLFCDLQLRSSTETITDYIIRVEKIAISLKTSGEIISGSL